jgi:hypothetical protein
VAHPGPTLVGGRTVDLLGGCLFAVDGSDGITAPVGILIELDHHGRGVLSIAGARELSD